MKPRAEIIIFRWHRTPVAFRHNFKIIDASIIKIDCSHICIIVVIYTMLHSYLEKNVPILTWIVNTTIPHMLDHIDNEISENGIPKICQP